MVVLGVDPGTAATGYGVVGEEGGRLSLLHSGCIRTSPDSPVESRLDLIFGELSGLLAAWRPDAAAVEELFFNRNVRSALQVGQARGVVLLAAARAGIPVAEFTPLEVKLAVTGYGRADKRQVQEMVRVLLGLEAPPRPDHAADALAVALCCVHSLAGAAARRRGGLPG